MALKAVHIPTPRTYEYVTLLDKRDFADVIKLKILRRRDYPDYLDGPNVITGSL